MFLYLTLAIVTGFLAYCFAQYRSLTHHIKEAKATGLPYVVVPFGLSGLLSVLLQALLLSFLNRIPEVWTERWIPYVTANCMPLGSHVADHNLPLQVTFSYQEDGIKATNHLQ